MGPAQPIRGEASIGAVSGSVDCVFAWAPGRPRRNRGRGRRHQSDEPNSARTPVVSSTDRAAGQAAERYVAELRTLFDELRRVLRPEGVVWFQPPATPAPATAGLGWAAVEAIRNDGWILRNAIICHTADHPTRGYQTLFLLVRNRRYFFDLDAIHRSSASPAAGESGASWRRSGANPGDVWTMPSTNRMLSPDPGEGALVQIARRCLAEHPAPVAALTQ